MTGLKGVIGSLRGYDSRISYVFFVYSVHITFFLPSLSWPFGDSEVVMAISSAITGIVGGGKS